MKKWFWLIGCDNSNPDPLVADESDLGEYDESQFRLGRRVDGWPGTAFVRATTAENDGEPDDVLQTCLHVQVFSPRLCSAMVSADIGGIQYLPLRVLKSDGVDINGFSIINILNCLDALHCKFSEVSRYPADYVLPERRGLIRGVIKPVLIDSVVEPYDIVRLTAFNTPVYVSSRFVKVFEAERFTGCSFHQVMTSAAD